LRNTASRPLIWDQGKCLRPKGITVDDDPGQSCCFPAVNILRFVAMSLSHPIAPMPHWPLPPRSQSDIRAPEGLDWRKFWSRSLGLALALVLSDCLALALAWKLAVRLNQFYSPVPPELNWGVWWGLPGWFWIFAAITVALFILTGLYRHAEASQRYLRAGQLVSAVYLSSLVLLYFYDPKLDPPRSLFFTAWFSSVGLVIGFRLVTRLLLRQLQPGQVSVFVISQADRLANLAQTLERRSAYRVVGAALTASAHSQVTFQRILRSGAREVLAEDLPPTALASSLYWQLRRAGITLRLLPSSREMLHRRGAPEVVAGLPTLRVEAPLSLFNGLDYRLKRTLDWFGALFGVVLLAPLFIGVAIAIGFTSPGPVFYRQARMGLQGRVFYVWKFRTMIVGADRLQSQLEQQNQSKDGVMFKLKHDPRITPVGRFLRRTSLDELPQLFNVLLGQMSLVGPRPLPLRDISHFATWHHIRHQVLPGITGLWQISGRSDIDDFDHAVRLDLYYIDNWSLNLDLDILVETVRIVLFGKGAY